MPLTARARQTAPAGQAAVSAPSAGQPAPRPQYAILRQDEDWSFLQDAAQRADWWDSAKYIALGRGSYITLGGQARPFYESIENEFWGASRARHNAYLLQRYMLHADVHAGPAFRVFLELKSGLQNDRIGGPRPPDKDELDFNQLFFDVRLAVNSKAKSRAGFAPTLLRVGRQELDYGAGRLISVREGPNVRQSYDGVNIITRPGDWRADAFFVRPVATRPNLFDDGTLYNELLWGVYATGPLGGRRTPDAPRAPAASGCNLDAYYIGQERRQAQYDQGTARETRHTVGARLWGQSGRWDYDLETAYQFGRFGTGSISAASVSFNAGHTFARTWGRPRLGLEGGYNSGDRDPKNPDMQTFYAPYPRGSYFGQIGANGPANSIGFSPALNLRPVQNVQMAFNNYFFWRDSARDGVYGTAGGLLRTGQQSRAHFVGVQPAFQTDWQADRHISVTLNVTEFFAGRFLKDTPPSRDIHYTAFWVTYLF